MLAFLKKLYNAIYKDEAVRSEVDRDAALKANSKLIKELTTKPKVIAPKKPRPKKPTYSLGVWIMLENHTFKYVQARTPALLKAEIDNMYSSVFVSSDGTKHLGENMVAGWGRIHFILKDKKSSSDDLVIRLQAEKQDQPFRWGNSPGLYQKNQTKLLLTKWFKANLNEKFKEWENQGFPTKS